MKEFDECLLGIVSRNIESEKKRMNDIDTKAIGIITIVGILVVFLSKPENLGRLSATLFLLTTLSFLITILLCVLVIRVRWFDIISTNYLMEDLGNESPERQIGGLIGTSAKVEESISDKCNQKANVLRYAVFALGTSVVILILYSLSALL